MAEQENERSVGVESWERTDLCENNLEEFNGGSEEWPLGIHALKLLELARLNLLLERLHPVLASQHIYACPPHFPPLYACPPHSAPHTLARLILLRRHPVDGQNPPVI